MVCRFPLCLLGYHSVLIITNQTTWELMRNDRIRYVCNDRIMRCCLTHCCLMHCCLQLSSRLAELAHALRQRSHCQRSLLLLRSSVGDSTGSPCSLWPSPLQLVAHSLCGSMIGRSASIGSLEFGIALRCSSTSIILVGNLN